MKPISRNVTIGALAAISAAAGILLPATLSRSGAAVAVPSGATASGPVPESRIVHMLRKEAADFGDPHPTSMGYVRVTRGSVISYISGATLDPLTQDTPVVLARAWGRFTEQTRGIGGTQGDAVLRGPAVDLILDLQTGRILDYGIDTAPIALSSLGQLVRLC